MSGLATDRIGWHAFTSGLATDRIGWLAFTSGLATDRSVGLRLRAVWLLVGSVAPWLRAGLLLI
ncbi:hypothetical protein [Sporosarcina sp. FSL K6-1508]|uniref:hypothetical protein n=1 Tax=Sporosarcina sp. FSL K6-1508 TaxID=2921553 RepID=UPI0030FB5D0D